MQKPKLLIVEDEFDLSEMVTTYFRVQNYDVVAVAFGEEAIDAAKSQDFDLMLLDIRLPDMDGYELCEKLRQQRRSKDTPIIFLTGQRERMDKLQGLKLGVVDYITKPFDIKELRLRVRNAINRANTPSMLHAVTDLPEGDFVRDKIEAVLQQDKWALLAFIIDGLDTFRGRYGFVAADDVLRAISLIIKNAVADHGTPDDFLGHLRSYRLVVITEPNNALDIDQRVRTRLAQNNDYFYPQAPQDASKDIIKVEAELITQADGPFANVDELVERVTQQFQTDTTVTRLPMGPAVTFRRATTEQLSAIAEKSADEASTQPTKPTEADDPSQDDTISARDDSANEDAEK